MRAVVVDDEPLARSLLVEMLSELADVEVVGEYGDGATALEGLHRDRPDLLFLDVRMPELDGFEVVANLPDGPRPAIVFVTAYDEHALRAFEVEAIDYLLKPFDEERLRRAVERARERVGSAADVRRLRELLAALADSPGRPDRLVVWQGERALFVPLARIDWVEADGKQVKVHAGEQELTMREPLSSLAEELAPRGFLRVSRSAVVNTHRIREIQQWFHGDHVVVLHNGDRVKTTRGYRREVVRLLRGR